MKTQSCLYLFIQSDYSVRVVGGWCGGVVDGGVNWHLGILLVSHDMVHVLEGGGWCVVGVWRRGGGVGRRCRGVWRRGRGVWCRCRGVGGGGSSQKGGEDDLKEKNTYISKALNMVNSDIGIF